MKRIKPRLSKLQKKVKKGFRGFPAATVALYGPTDKLATKIAVAIFSGPGRDPDVLERWFSPTGDVDIRRDPRSMRRWLLSSNPTKCSPWPLRMAYSAARTRKVSTTLKRLLARNALTGRRRTESNKLHPSTQNHGPVLNGSRLADDTAKPPKVVLPFSIVRCSEKA
jgi:hypothetical protein